MAERLSLIIFGATGFTGKYAVEEVHRISKKDKSITWAIAGRSQSKLEKIIKDLQAKTGDDLTKIKIIIADVGDIDSLKEMSKQAKVVVNCCGPYRFYGEPVVKACIETQTSHVDVSGEPAYMEKMQLAYNEAAQKAGVYIVSACGFDSIPADLGVVFTEQSFKGTVNSIESYLETSVSSNYRGSGSAAIHYGTWESLVYGIAEQKELGPLRRQLYPDKLPQQLPKLKSRSIIHKNEDANLWCLPFMGSDKSVVYRSQRFFHDSEKKRPVQLYPYVGFRSIFVPLILSCYGIFLFLMAQFKCGRKFLLKYPRLFSLGYISHEGPSEDLMNNTKFSMTFYAKGWDEKDGDVNGKPLSKEMKTKVTGTNPGYGATCTTLVYSGITIVKESDKMPGKGGVLAPGAAFSKTSLINTLNENGVTFEIIN